MQFVRPQALTAFSITSMTLMRTISKYAIAAAAIALVGFSIAPAAADTVPQPKPFTKGDVGLQMFGWNWNSIAKECTTVLGPAGVDWIQTMPPQDHITGAAWWVHYQPTSYSLNSYMGNRAQFANMVSTCNKAGVNVVTDAVLNHMAGSGGVSYDGVSYGGENLIFGNTYTAKNFHEGLSPSDPHYCANDISNWDDTPERFDCRFPGLPDLATEQPYVRQQIANYLNDQLSLGVAGFRLDAAKHIPPADIAAIEALLTKKDAFIVQEVPGSTQINADYLPTGYVWAWDTYTKAVSMFGYPGAAYRGGVYDTVDTPDYVPTDRGITWVTNHDTEHHGGAVTYQNGKAYELANIWLLSEKYGSPMLYTGYAFAEDSESPPFKNTSFLADAVCATDGGKIKPQASGYKNGQFVCLQRWTSIKGMIAWRDAVGEAAKTNLYAPKAGATNSGVYAFGRSGNGYVAINSRATAVKLTGIATGMKAGTYCDMISGGNKPIKVKGKSCVGLQVIVDKAGKVSTAMPAQSAFAIATTSKLK